MQAVDKAFGQIIQANATITAHLNSLREIQELQDDILKRLKLGDLRDKVTDGLNDVSKKADEVLEIIKEAEGIKN
ncbi:MAG: hypothetical protein P9X24_01715 [Candidatus Hatepunaea meridiana]|nr:hypothetical protein [Candidatus Hatepunaea meridiana]